MKAQRRRLTLGLGVFVGVVAPVAAVLVWLGSRVVVSPSSAAVCDHLVRVARKSPPTFGENKDLGSREVCTDVYQRFRAEQRGSARASLGNRLSDRLRDGNAARCLARIEHRSELYRCIDRYNDAWPQAALHAVW